MQDEAQNIINQTAAYVKEALSTDASGHDWWHIYRVWRMAQYLSQFEHVDNLVVQLSALLHDIADWKFHQGDDKASAEKAKQWLIVTSVTCRVWKDFGQPNDNYHYVEYRYVDGQ